MSLTILIIALLPASVVFLVAAVTRSQFWTALTAIVAAGDAGQWRQSVLLGVRFDLLHNKTQTTRS
ncbi:hypothetical protein [Variovorax boronicumulans]